MSYVLSANVNRRNLTKGQRAMAVARLLIKSTREAAKEVDANYTYVSRARSVIEHAPELVDAVMVGTVPLSDAYAEAKQRKEAKESREEKTRRDEVLTDC
ncbi:MAG: hypothetical protein M3R02_10485 [Chloroflexota bacterium]|nr:hypothetical protein [Chloroflexota bacterium]